MKKIILSVLVLALIGAAGTYYYALSIQRIENSIWLMQKQ